MSSPSRIDQRFEQLRQSGKAAFVAYIAAGDPTMDRSLEVMQGLDRAGVDVIELGVPFSDPMADGIVNQMAAHRALEAGATLQGTLNLIARFRETSQTPVVLFTYLNPVYAYGFCRFHEDAATAGADGILLLDLPPEAAAENPELTVGTALQKIRLVAPTTPADRLPDLTRDAEGFIYYVSREGVTGTQTDLAEGIAENVALIQRHTPVPIVVGFGISTPEQAADVARSADGVVVGSAIVKKVEAHQNDPALSSVIESFVKPLVDATKSV